MLFVSGIEDFSPKILIITEKSDYVGLDKGVAIDLLSRVPCTLGEMNNARWEEKLFRAVDNKVNIEVLNNPRVEWVSLEKADKGENARKQTDREGNWNMDQIVGPLSTGLPENEEEVVPAQGVLAQNHPDFSAQLELELRESQSRTQHLSQKGFFMLPRNRGKHSML
ncbi:hypothetical protein Ancab_019922, partial [Ancistrocladus abbreviatus]